MTARQKIRGKYDSCVACYFATDGKRKTRKMESKREEWGGESGEKGTYEAYIGEGRPKTGMYRAVNRIEEMKRDGERRGKKKRSTTRDFPVFPLIRVSVCQLSNESERRVPSRIYRALQDRMHLDAEALLLPRHSFLNEIN